MRRFLFVLLVLFIGFAIAKKQPAHRHLEILPQEVLGELQQSALTVQSLPIMATGYYPAQGSPEEMAWQYLENNASRLGISRPQETLKHYATRQTLAGQRVRFKQAWKGYPVYGASVVVTINNRGEVSFVSNGTRSLPTVVEAVKMTPQQAIDMALKHLGASAETDFLEAETVVFAWGNDAFLAQRVRVLPRDGARGDWEFIIHGADGRIVLAQDRACYAGENDGRGWVYDPDPITRSGADYGTGGFRDNGDSDSEALTAQLVEVDLPVTFQDSLYQLKSPYAHIVDYESPLTGLHAQDSAHFFFTRSQDGFEAANVFYHIHHSMKYINETLGIALMPFQYEGGVRFDPHGLNGEDNAWYVSSRGYVAFGDGGVADAEDHDVVIHELGHGIHDWITDGALSQVDGLSEGASDYWAQSYKRSLGFLLPGDAKYDWVFSWDGHNEFWDGRITNTNAHYPEDLVDQVHTDGQMWSASLMQIYDQIGREATDILFLEGMSMLNERSSQRDAAYAFIQADRDLYGGAHLDVILEVFANRGYISDPVTVLFDADRSGGPAGMTVNFTDFSFAWPDTITSRAWDFDADGTVDSNEKNPSFTYNEPGLYSVILSVSDGSNSSSDTLYDFVSVNAGVYVWEGVKNNSANSGVYIRETLERMGLQPAYSRSDKLPSSLVGYDAAFLSFGNRGNGSRRLEDSTAAIIKNYLKSGGYLYMDGGDILGHDRASDGELLQLLGLESVEDGQTTPVTMLRGSAGSLADSLEFRGSGQGSFSSIDRYTAQSSGDLLFEQPGYGTVAVAHEDSAGHRSVVFSYAMGALADSLFPHTREDLLFRIAQFFELETSPLARFSVSPNSGHAPHTAIFYDQSLIAGSKDNLTWSWDLDGDGQDDAMGQQAQFTFDEAGRYDVRLTLQDNGTPYSNTVPQAVRVFNGESALRFSNQYFEAQADSLNITEALTIEFWFYPEDWGPESNGNARILDKEYLRVFLSKNRFARYNAESLVFYMEHDSSTSMYSTPANTIALNEWQHVAITYDGATSQPRIYLNGEEQTVKRLFSDAEGPIKNHGEFPLYLGMAQDGSKQFSGAIDELRFWNVARTPQQIAEHWNRYQPQERDGLVAYWQMNEAFGDTLTDLSNGISAIVRKAEWVEGKPDLLPVPLLAENANRLKQFKLYANYPNPFNPQTTVRYDVPRAGDVTLALFDVLGRRVKTLVSGRHNPGSYKIVVDGSRLSSGIYYLRMQAGTFMETRKAVLIK